LWLAFAVDVALNRCLFQDMVCSRLVAFVGRRYDSQQPARKSSDTLHEYRKDDDDLANLKVRNVMANSRNENPTICCNRSMEKEKKAESINESIELVSSMVPEYRAFPGLPDA
jgi:hypothetical protein